MATIKSLTDITLAVLAPVVLSSPIMRLSLPRVVLKKKEELVNRLKERGTDDKTEAITKNATSKEKTESKI